MESTQGGSTLLNPEVMTHCTHAPKGEVLVQVKDEAGSEDEDTVPICWFETDESVSDEKDVTGMEQAEFTTAETLTISQGTNFDRIRNILFPTSCVSSNKLKHTSKINGLGKRKNSLNSGHSGSDNAKTNDKVIWNMTGTYNPQVPSLPRPPVQKVTEPPAQTHSDYLESMSLMCGTCLKTFPTSSDLHFHSEKMHREEITFKCNICEKTVKNEGQLSRHKTLVHNIKEKPYKCEKCPNRYCKKSTLKMHMESHSEDGNMECKICHKVFTRRNCFNRHMQIHSTYEPVECDICRKTFSSKLYLTMHKSTVHNE